MTFRFKAVLGYRLQVFGVQICIALHCARAPSLLVAVSQVTISPSGLFLKCSQNFANFSLDILIKYILIKKKECMSPQRFFSIVIFLQTNSFTQFFSFLLVCAKYFHCLIKLFFEGPRAFPNLLEIFQKVSLNF